MPELMRNVISVLYRTNDGVLVGVTVLSKEEEAKKKAAEEKKVVSRRQFVTGTVGGLVVGAAAGAAAGALGFPRTETVTQTATATATATPWLPEKWDKEVDVVVVGYGFAGAAAAITAADNGAKVVLLEKQAKDKHTANSQMCFGVFISPSSADDAYAYMKILSRINLDLPETQDMDDELIKVWADSMTQNKDWLTQLGIKDYVVYADKGRHVKIKGNDSIKAYMMKMPNGPAGVGVDLFNFLAGIVDAKKVETLWETPATKLISNDKGEVVGVKARSKGGDINIKAAKGVILTTGGYEYDDAAVRAFSPVYPIVFYGNPDNTGDGMHMAQEAGAALWHMYMLGGGLKAKFKDFPTAFLTLAPGGSIIVDKSGKRFQDETLLGGYSSYWLTMYIDVNNDTFPRIPCYWVFDEATRKAGPIVFTMFAAAGPIGMYEWSKDNSKEIEKGWIVKGDTIEDLAKKIGLDPAVLEDQVARYNDAVKAKKDPDFGRDPNTMVALDKPPFYAVTLWPGMNNTFGGPRRNAKAQIVSLDGNPIPRLYSAGELGSVYVHYPQGGANVGECFAFGRIAGKNAAAERPWE